MKPKVNKLFLFVFAGLVALVVLLPTLQNGWTSWDDKVYVIDNPLIKSLSYETIQAIFLTPEYNGAYTPLPMLSWALNYHFTGTNAFPFHLTNLILHLANTLLCFVFIGFLTENLIVAFFVSILFGIHPMHLEPIAWITGRKDLLLGVFSLCSLIAWTKFDGFKQTRLLFYFLAILFTVLALFSKATAVVLPVWFMLISILRYRKKVVKSFITLLPFWVITIGFGLIAISAQQESGAMKTLGEIDFLRSSVFTITSLGTYLIKLIIPYHIGGAHNYPSVIDFSSTVGFLIAVTLFGISIIYLLVKRSQQVLLLSLLFLLVGLLPILQFLPVGYALTADRYAYIPYVGGFLAIGVGLMKLIEFKRRFKKLTFVGFGIYAFALGCSSWTSASIWNSDLTLWNNELTHHVYAPRAYVNRGQYYAKNGLTQLALSDYNTALLQDPNLKEAYQKKGLALQELKEYKRAENSFLRALEIDSLYTPAMLNLALNAYHLRDLETSFKYLDVAEKTEPRNLLIYLNRGVLYQQLRNNDKALNNYSTAIQVAPFNVRGYRFRGVLYFELGKLELAHSDFLKWQELNSKDPMVYRWLARWASKKKNSELFLKNASMAKELGGPFQEQEFSQLLQQLEP